MDKLQFILDERARLEKEGLLVKIRTIESAQGAWIAVDGKRVLNLCSNNYLGLTCHPRVREAAVKAMEKYGSGCAGSRFLNGNLEIHEEFERKLASFFKKKAALIFATGYQTNVGTISALVGRNDTAILDKYNHASIIDGCRLSFGDAKKYRHNDMNDLHRGLEATSECGQLIIVDGVFSMEGDIADLPSIVRLAKNYGARVMVDDALGIGVLGKTGRGTAEYFGLEDQVDIIMGTYS